MRTIRSIHILITLLYHDTILVVVSSLTSRVGSSTTSTGTTGSTTPFNLPPFQPPNSNSNNNNQQKMMIIQELGRKAMNYFDSSTDPFHAVHTSIQLLQQAGFQPLQDKDLYSLSSSTSSSIIQPNGKYYYTKNKSTLVAFTVGDQFVIPSSSSNHDTHDHDTGTGFIIIGGHTDSPNLRVKPRSKRSSPTPSGNGCIQLGVECYGGGLWYTWFDRDLSISGRVFLKNQTTGKVEQKLVQIKQSLLRISNLAIHLQSEDERKAFKVNKEEHLSPIIAMEVQKALTGSIDTGSTESTVSNEDSTSITTNTPASTKATTTTTTDKNNGWYEYQEPTLLYALAYELQCHVNDIVDFELHLYDVQKAALGGAYSEFIHSGRLDNLASCFMAVEALIQDSTASTSTTTTTTDTDTEQSSSSSTLLSNNNDIKMIVLYDHEEVGSTSAVGAASPILNEAIDLITRALVFGQQKEQGQQTIHSHYDLSAIVNACKARSFVLSSDQAHALHPNYSQKHEKNHQPKINQGMVIKRNTNQRYATTPLTGLIMRHIAEKGQLQYPLQEFMIRQDCGCGSTIGPIISANTGIRTIDMGCPQLSMHSIRETMGVHDIYHGYQLFRAYFRYFREVDTMIEQ